VQARVAEHKRMVPIPGRWRFLRRREPRKPGGRTMIGLKQAFGAAASVASLAVVVAVVTPRAAFGAGNATGQQP